MQKSVLIVGTASGVGKTVVMMAIAAYYQTFCSDRSIALYTPISSGRRDPQQYQAVLNLAQSLDELSTISITGEGEPALLAAQENQAIDLAAIWKDYQSLASSHDLVLIEAFGGLGTPLTQETTVADLAWDWRLPTLLVVPVRPGAMGEAIAHVALARHSRVHLKGIILTCPTPMSDDDVVTVVDAAQLQSMTQIPVLGCIPYLEAVGDRSKLAQAASNLDIERILPFL
ncbi:MAG: dethiobiotin synthase [Leptolyngbyaceae bacterium]|nr:dethiobiotin synthase [Leptolyngbyaceae bacterium]